MTHFRSDRPTSRDRWQRAGVVLALSLGVAMLAAACTPSGGGTALPPIPLVNGLTLAPGQQTVTANFTVDWHGGAVGSCALSVNGGTAVAGPCTSITVSGLTPNIGYSATVSALDGFGQTGYGTGTFATTTPPPPGISGLNFGSPSQTSVTAGFNVDWRGYATGSCSFTIVGGPSTAGACSAISLGGLAPGTAYTGIVYATDTFGQQSSASGTFATASPPPSPAVSLAKGPSANGQPGCTVAACRFLDVSIANFAPNATVSVQCWGNVGGSSSFYTYSMSTNGAGSGFSRVCYFGYPGYQAWAVVNGVQSNHIVW